MAPQLSTERHPDGLRDPAASLRPSCTGLRAAGSRTRLATAGRRPRGGKGGEVGLSRRPAPSESSGNGVAGLSADEALSDNIPGLGRFYVRKDKLPRKRRRDFVNLGRSQRAAIVRTAYGVIERVCDVFCPGERMELLDAIADIHPTYRRRYGKRLAAAQREASTSSESSSASSSNTGSKAPPAATRPASLRKASSSSSSPSPPSYAAVEDGNMEEGCEALLELKGGRTLSEGSEGSAPSVAEAGMGSSSGSLPSTFMLPAPSPAPSDLPYLSYLRDAGQQQAMFMGLQHQHQQASCRPHYEQHGGPDRGHGMGRDVEQLMRAQDEMGGGYGERAPWAAATRCRHRGYEEVLLPAEPSTSRRLISSGYEVPLEAAILHRMRYSSSAQDAAAPMGWAGDPRLGKCYLEER